MFIKNLTDVLKMFMQIFDEVKSFGVVYSILFLWFWPMAYFIFEIIDSDALVSYALALLIYQLCGLLICIFYYLYRVPDYLKDNSLPITSSYGTFLKEAFKSTLVTFWYHFSQLFMVYFVSLTNKEYEITVYSLLMTIQSIIYNFFVTMALYPGTELAKLVGMCRFSGSFTIYREYLMIYALFGVFIHIIGQLFILILQHTGIYSEDFVKLIDSCSIPWLFLSFVQCF